MAGLKTKSGKAVHPIGIGTWDIGSRRDMVEKRVVPVYGNEAREIEGIRYSLAAGQNHIDGAEMYGGGYTDEVIGRAINGMRREDLFIADKLWKTSVPRGKVRPAVENMLHKLGTDYLDLLYIHAPWEDAPWLESITQINGLIDDGMVRQFGVSNFNVAQMQEAITASRYPVVANQLYYNVLYKQDATEEVWGFCKQHDIKVVAYRPVERAAVLDDAVIRKVARAHGATPAQIALAWLLEKGALPIPKAVTKSHIDENLGALKVRLTADDLRELDAL